MSNVAAAVAAPHLIQTSTFEARNEFADAPASPAAPAKQDTARAAGRPAQTRTSESAAGRRAARSTDAAAKPTESTPPTETDEPTDQPEPTSTGVEGEEVEAPASSADEVSFIEIKGDGKTKRYNLKPDDPQLKRALEFGEAAPRWKRERDEARNELKSEREAKAALQDKVGVWDTLDELTRLGYHEEAAEAVLSKEGIDAFKRAVIAEYEAEQAGDQAAAARIQSERNARRAKLREHFNGKELSKREQAIQVRETEAEQKRLNSLGVAALQRVNFKDVFDDPDLASSYNQKLWKLAWADLEEQADEGVQLTPAAIQAAFEQNAKILKSGITKSADRQVTRTIEATKETAKRQAQAVATARYPARDLAKAEKAVADWDGRSSKALLKSLLGK